MGAKADITLRQRVIEFAATGWELAVPTECYTGGMWRGMVIAWQWRGSI